MERFDEYEILSRIASPADLKALSMTEVVALAAEIRSYLSSRVRETGGHLAPNLGAVELTLAGGAFPA